MQAVDNCQNIIYLYANPTNDIMQRIVRVLTNPLGKYFNCKLNKLINTVKTIQ